MLNKMRNFMKLENREWQFNNFIVEIIDTKLYKKKQKGRNGNKSLEALLLPQFFNSSDVMTYKLMKIIQL